MLAAMNPLVLLTLIGGAHNDAIMTGFLGGGLALAVQRHPVWALFFVSLRHRDQGAGRDRPRLRRVELARARRPRSSSGCARSLIGGVVAAAVLGVTTLAGGLRLRLGRQSALQRHRALLGGAGDRRSGMALTDIVHALGLHSVTLGSVLSVTRFLGLVAAAASRSGCSGARASAAGCARSGCRSCSSSSSVRSSSPGTSRGGSWCSPRATRAASTSGCCCCRSPGPSSACPADASCSRASCTRNPLLIALARRDPRRRAARAHGALDPVVLARARGRAASSSA